MAGKTSRVNKGARKKGGQKKSKVHCKEYVKQMDEVKTNIVENNEIAETGKPSVVVVPPKWVHCKQIGNPDFRQLRDQEMWPEIMNWRMSIVGHYRNDVKMYPFVNRNFEWDLNKKNSNLLKEHENSEGKRSAAEMARDLGSFLGTIANLVPNELRPWVLEKSNSFEGIMNMIKGFYKDKESKEKQIWSDESKVQVISVREDKCQKVNGDRDFLDKSEGKENDGKNMVSSSITGHEKSTVENDAYTDGNGHKIGDRNLGIDKFFGLDEDKAMNEFRDRALNLETYKIENVYLTEKFVQLEDELRLTNDAHNEKVILYETKIKDLAILREDLVKANEEKIRLKEELNIVRQEKVRFKEELDNMRKEKENLIGQLGGNTKLEGRDEKMKQVRVLDNVKNDCGVLNGEKSKASREESSAREKISDLVKQLEIRRMSLIISQDRLNIRQVNQRARKQVRVPRYRPTRNRIGLNTEKSLEQRTPRIVKTLPRTRGFLPQDFLPILERIPNNYVYAPNLREKPIYGFKHDRI